MCYCKHCHREYDVNDFTDESEACDDCCPDCLHSGNMFGPERDEYEYMDPDGDGPYLDPYEDTPQEEVYEELLDDVELPEDEEFEEDTI